MQVADGLDGDRADQGIRGRPQPAGEQDRLGRLAVAEEVVGDPDGVGHHRELRDARQVSGGSVCRRPRADRDGRLGCTSAAAAARSAPWRPARARLRLETRARRWCPAGGRWRRRAPSSSGPALPARRCRGERSCPTPRAAPPAERCGRPRSLDLRQDVVLPLRRKHARHRLSWFDQRSPYSSFRLQPSRASVRSGTAVSTRQAEHLLPCP